MMNKQILRKVVFGGIFLVPFIPFLVSSSLFFPFVTTKVFVWRTIVEIIFAVWAILAISDAEYRPKKSPILYGVLAFLLVIGLADLFGVDRIKSFWSNFERMEGYLSLLHLGAYFLVVGSVFRERDWTKWWNTTLVASLLMVFYVVFQLLGIATINQGGVRVDGTFGNATYLAVYMLFHIFVALFFMVREWRNTSLRYSYGFLILAQTLILYFTATRGAIIGLLGGLLVLAILNLRNKEDKVIRKMSVGLLVALISLVGVFFLARNSSFVQKSPVLLRFATLNLSELKSQGRYFVWPMAVEGFKERPLLGWGEDNFSYVFQEHYDPKMYILEPWFDHAHNIFLDWLVAGGFLGVLAYLSLYFIAFYLIWLRTNFSLVEKTILIALISAYFFHNFFVFDHLVSYILFFSLLAYLHSRYEGQELWQRMFTEAQVKRFFVPIISIVFIFTFYTVNWKPLVSNINLIGALRSLNENNFSSAITYFEKAYNASSFGRPEVVEQMTTHAVSIFTSNLPLEERNAFYAFINKAVDAEEGEFGNDARYHIMAGSYYSSVGSFDRAIKHLEEAKTLIPGKQVPYFELGAVYINQKDYARALEVFKQAYDLAPEYKEAKIIYLIGAIYANNPSIEAKMKGELEKRDVVFDDRVINAYYAVGRTGDVRSLINERKNLDPKNSSVYDSYLNQLNQSN